MRSAMSEAVSRSSQTDQSRVGQDYSRTPLHMCRITIHLNAMSVEKSAAEIRETFAFLDDWETRYEHIIDLGKALPDLTDADRQDLFKVRGCASQVWIVPDEAPDAATIRFRAQSDALIVSGLIALLTQLYNDQPAAEVLSFDAPGFFSEIGLNEALSAQRANGLRAMLERIQNMAEARLSGAG